MSSEVADAIEDAVKVIAPVIRSISHGDTAGPAGLEGLAMALAGAGDFDNNNVASGLRDIAEAIEGLADSIRVHTAFHHPEKH